MTLPTLHSIGVTLRIDLDRYVWTSGYILLDLSEKFDPKSFFGKEN